MDGLRIGNLPLEIEETIANNDKQEDAKKDISNTNPVPASVPSVVKLYKINRQVNATDNGNKINENIQK